MAANRRARARTIRLYIIAAVLALLVGAGGLAVFGLFLQTGIEANSHLAAAVGDYDRDNLPAAERELRTALSIKADLYDARFDLAIVLLKEGRYAAALAELRRAEGIKELATAHLYAGVADLAMHRPDLARDEARAGLAQVGQDPDIDALLATADRQLGHAASAEQEYATARSEGYQGQTVRDWIAQAALTQD